MTQISTKSIPPLPVELVWYIMEIAADTDKNTASSLTRVSKTVQGWITPILDLDHTVILPTHCQLQSFKYTLQSSSGTNVGALVRRLFVKDEFFFDYEVRPSHIVCGCPGLEVLAIDGDVGDLIPEGFALPGPWHIMLGYVPNYNPTTGHPLLRNITHLYIDKFSQPFVKAVPTLRLTHLGFECRDQETPDLYPEWIMRILSWPSLVMLILHRFTLQSKPEDIFMGEKWFKLSQIKDKRLLAGPGLVLQDRIELVKSGSTIWDGAEVRYKDWREKVVR